MLLLFFVLNFAPSKVEQFKILTTMKKIYTFMMVALVGMMFTACEERYWYDTPEDRYDRDEAYVLEGNWTGYVETYLYDRFGLRGNSYRTTMHFDRYDNYGGIGYEIDYDLNSPYEDYYYCDFEWEVVNGEVIIYYADSWNPVYIYDYGLTSERFWGYMDDGTSKDIRFELYYDGRFDWSYWTRSLDITRTDGKGYHASGKFAKKTEKASE